ncbi:MAG: hypothetical protein EBR82_23940 [Caulobacteraceae bacterium]|nr:hypothetical protein [Caulobacteraceae bacterium]
MGDIVKTRAWLVFLGGAAVAAALAFWLPAGQRMFAGMTTGLLVLVAAVTALNASPAGMAFVERRAAAIKAAGWALVALGMAAMIATPFTPLAPDVFAWVLYPCAGLAVVGIMTAQLPRMLNDARMMRQATEQATGQTTGRAVADKDGPPPSTRAFNGPSEGLRAALAPVREAGVFLQITVPWVAVIAGFLLMAMASVGNASRWPWNSTATLLFLMAPLFLLALAAIPTMVVGWARWAVRRETPRYGIALPGRAVPSVTWRLWVAGTVIGIADRLVTGAVASLVAEMGGSPDVATMVVSLCVNLILIAAATGWALKLIALAVGDTTFNQPVALIRTRALWPDLPLGMLLATAPWMAVGVAFDLAVGPWNLLMPPVLRLMLLMLPVLIFAAGLASATTYAARVYRALAQTDPQPEV